MVKFFHSKHGRNINPVFTSPIQSFASQTQIGRDIKKRIHHPSEKQERIGKGLEKVGGLISTIGTLTEQPEISGLGLGIQATGDVVEGGKNKEIAKRLVGTVAGAIAGQVAGEAGFNPVNQVILGNLGSKVGTKLVDSITDRTHDQQIKTQIVENQASDDQEHQNQVQLPSDLQSGNQVIGIGEKLKTNPTDIAKNTEEFDKDIKAFENGIEILEFLVNNYNTFEHLSNADKDEVLGVALQTGLLDKLVDNLL